MDEYYFKKKKIYTQLQIQIQQQPPRNNLDQL